jgi:DNA repair/transcription protein MET18/MMS19
LILDITFPAFLAELPDSETVERLDASIKVRKGYKEILAALAQVSTERAIFEALLRRLFSKLDIVLSSTTALRALLMVATTTIMYPHAIIGTIYLVLQKKSQRSDVDVPSYMETLLPTFFDMIIVPATTKGPRTRTLCNREILHVVSLIVNTIVRAADLAAQTSFYRELFKLFVSCEASALISSNQDFVAATFRPLAPDADDVQAGTVEVFVSAIAGARKEVRNLAQIGLLTGDPASYYGCQSFTFAGCRDGVFVPRRSAKIASIENDCVCCE